MYVIISGSVDITKIIGDKNQVLAVLEAGDFFGEMAILTREQRSASAYCHDNCTLLIMDYKTALITMKGNPNIAMSIMKKMAKRLQDTNEMLSQFMLKNSLRKIIDYLENLTNEKKQIANGILIESTIDEIAANTGLEIEVVEKDMKHLYSKKIMYLTKSGIFIPNESTLKDFIEYLYLKSKFE